MKRILSVVAVLWEQFNYIAHTFIIFDSITLQQFYGMYSFIQTELAPFSTVEGGLANNNRSKRSLKHILFSWGITQIPTNNKGKSPNFVVKMFWNCLEFIGNIYFFPEIFDAAEPCL